MPAGSSIPDPETHSLSGDGTYAVGIVGESRYQDALEKICGGRSREGHERKVIAELVYEDSNPYDNQAVRVEMEGMTVGYLDRNLARSFRQSMKKAGFSGACLSCHALIVGGWDRGRGDKGHIGVNLDIKQIASK